MQHRRAVSWTAALAAAVVATTITWVAPATAAPAQAVAPQVAVAQADTTSPLCGATGTSLSGSGCRYATVGTDTFRAPYYQPNVTFTTYGARSSGTFRESHDWGGMSKGTLKLTPGASYQVNVGGPARGDRQEFGGFNGGGDSGRTSFENGQPFQGGDGGGGASDVREGSYGLTDRLIVAGGGGGFGGCTSEGCITGGAGGGANGFDGDNGIGSSGGGGGSQIQAGRSPGNAGSAGRGFGGNGGSGPVALAQSGAGGGGGYFGGGGSGAVVGAVDPSGGGGGSGYITPRATDTSSRTGGQVDAYPLPTDRLDIQGEKDGRGLVTATWPGGPTTANVTVTASPSGKVDPDTMVTLTTKVTTSTGVAPVGQIRFVDYSKAGGSTSPSAPDACPCSNITGNFVTTPDDGTYVKRIRAGSLPFGPDHAIVAIFDDLYGEIPLTRSAPATYSVNGAPPPGVDLGLTLTGTPDPMRVGSELTYTFGVTNYSDTAATQVRPTVSVRNVFGNDVVLDLSKTSSFCRPPIEGDTSVLCDFGDLAPGATETATIVVRPQKVGDQVASASLFRPAQTDPNPDNDFVEISTRVEAGDPPPPAEPTVSLGLLKTAPSRVDLGDVFTYSLDAYNGGPDTATGVTTTDVLPEGVTFVADGTSSRCSHASGTVTCDVGELLEGQSRGVEIAVRADRLGTVSNTATVAADQRDVDPSGNTSTATTVVREVPPPADLSIVKTAPARGVFRNDLVYTVAVTNNGPNAASEVVATDVLPSDVRFKSTGTSSSCRANFQQTTVTCDFGEVANGATETAQIVVIPDGVKRISNTATVDGGEPDPDPSNNSSTASTLVQDPFSPADLSIDKTASSSTVTVGDDITYELEVTNENTDNTSAFRVQATDTLPEGVTFKSADPGCTHRSGTVTCDLEQIFGAQSKTVEIVVTADRAGQVSNTATVEGGGVDPTEANDTSTAIVQVAGKPQAGTVGFAVTNHPVTEGGTASVTVTRTDGSDGSVSVGYATGNGTATAGDYTPTSGTLVFADGETTKTFTVATTQDSNVEPDETVSLRLSDATGGVTLGGAEATVTIVNDDVAPPPGPRCTIGSLTETKPVKLTGTARPDVICGGSGNDVITGGAGNDIIIGGGGNDTLQGGSGNDTIHGGAGRDRILGGSGNDTIVSGGGKDVIDGGSGRDTIDGRRDR